ncbi:heavy-metal-associated domain-containing protein [Acinetobacter sp. WZC-1]|uniref:heavy-metal-associated domain-containing protein n=1 Tax=Acinetobacter sp. WZC-1 TaxID=3459034 RepID=UPI00403E16B2
MKLTIENMTCDGCARIVTASIKAVDPAASVHIDVASKTVELESSEPARHILLALEEDGFSAVEHA